MHRNKLGSSDLAISQLGLGSWAIGGDIGDWGWGKQSEQDSINCIHAALDAGINWIDTAPAYGLGNAEKVIAKALQQTSITPFIFTKCGMRWQQGKSELSIDLSKRSLIEEVENSLKRLQVECIDLYQVHKPGNNNQIQEAWQTLSELKKQGKIRYIGVSNFNKQQMQLVNSIEPITSNQPAYSLLNRNIESSDLPWCLENSVGCIHHSTMSNGLLSGNMSKQRFTQLDKNDWRHKSHHFQEPNFSRNLKFVALLKQLTIEKNCSVAQLSIAWALKHPASTATIVGARNVQQLTELLPATEVKLNSDELIKIDEQWKLLQLEQA